MRSQSRCGAQESEMAMIVMRSLQRATEMKQRGGFRTQQKPRILSDARPFVA
jgi:lipopolysaccharide/colanic/teichoic acid biosynthesis glycosyltransferase